MIKRLVLVAVDVRSTHNVGSLLRTADGLGIEKMYMTGYTPYADSGRGDTRLPHVRQRAERQISKTALGAEKTVKCEHVDNIEELIGRLRSDGFAVAALEQNPKSKKLSVFKSDQDIALLVGSEVNGLDKKLLKQCDFTLEIPMLGQKESFNVSVAAAIALYHLRFTA